MKRLFNVAVAVIVSLVGSVSSASPITYYLKPYDPGAPGGVELVGGFFQTDGTTGHAVPLDGHLLDWRVDMTDGASSVSLTPQNSALAPSNDPHLGFDITETDITFVEDGSFQSFSVSSGVTQAYWWRSNWAAAGVPSTFTIRVNDVPVPTQPAPGGVGNVASVPEPSAIALAVIGLVVLLGWRWRRSVTVAAVVCCASPAFGINMYWADSSPAGGVYTAQVSGIPPNGNQRLLWDAPPSTGGLAVLGGSISTGFQDRLWFIAQPPGVITARYADGSDPRDTSAPGLSGGIGGLAVDKVYKTLYTAASNSISRQALDGLHAPVTLPVSTIQAQQVAVKTSSFFAPDEFIVWTALGDGSAGRGIYRASLDGTEQTPLVEFADNSVNPFGIAVDLPGRVYWSDPLSGTIHRMNADGSGDAVILTAGGAVGSVAGLAMDLAGQTLYFADPVGGSVWRLTSLAGATATGLQLVGHSPSPYVVAFVPEPSSLALVAFGAVVIAGWRWRSRATR